MQLVSVHKKKQINTNQNKNLNLTWYVYYRICWYLEEDLHLCVYSCVSDLIIGDGELNRINCYYGMNRSLFLFILCTGGNSLAAASFNAYNLYEKHHEHQLHHPKEWVKYEYINYRARVRKKNMSYDDDISSLKLTSFYLLL